MEDDDVASHVILTSKERETLSDIMIEKADGVFLWVRLALASLQEGLMYEESFPELQSRLEKLPRELKELFTHLLERIQLDHRHESAKYLKLLRTSQELRGHNITSLMVALTSLQTPTDVDDALLAADELLRRCRNVEKRVLLRTAGLLELGASTFKSNTQSATHLQDYTSDRTRLRFVHRSAEEFFASENHSLSNAIEQDSEWNAAREIAHAQVRHMRHESIISREPYRDESGNFRKAPTSVMKYLALAETQVSADPSSTLDNVQRLCKQLQARGSSKSADSLGGEASLIVSISRTGLVGHEC